jgi:hypothetical protein
MALLGEARNRLSHCADSGGPKSIYYVGFLRENFDQKAAVTWIEMLHEHVRYAGGGRN